MKSILQKEKECYVCGTYGYLESHHIFYGTANRKKSERNGLKVWLCPMHHRDPASGVHYDKMLDRKLKQIAQQAYEQKHSREEFMQEFGKNYLEEKDE